MSRRAGRVRRAQREAPLDVAVSVRGDVGEDDRQRARDLVARLAGRVDAPVLHARVRLTRRTAPARAAPVVARAQLDLAGRRLRAQVSAASVREALHRLEDRLRRQLERVGGWEARRGARPTGEPGEWRHGQQPTRRPGYYSRPESQREVVRRPASGLDRRTPDEAAADMADLGEDFHLFPDAATGRDSVLYADPPGGYRLAQAGPEPAEDVGPTTIRLTVSGSPAPTLSRAAALERLEVTGWPFVFYTDEDTGRGAVVYHRYDGHYGLVTLSG